MAQNGPHGHQVSTAAASDDGHTAPPTTAAFSLTSAVGPYGNGGSSASNMGKNLIPDLNMEELDDSAGGSKNKPRSEAAAQEVATADADADADADKGKSVATADDGGEPNVNINLGERRKRMKGLFRALQDVMPHVPQKTDKVTLVGEAIQYIKFLQEKAAMLVKQELQEALALAREDAAARGEASSSFSPDVPGAAPEAPAVPAPQIRFNTWTAPNVVLTVDNNNAYISVYGPRRAKNLSMVMFVLDNHGIDVITVQISADSVSALVLIFAHVNGTDEANRSSEEVYQRAVAEITYRLHSRSN